MDDNLDEKEQLMFFRLLPKELASDVFVEIETDTQERLIKAFTDKELKAVIGDMFLDDMTVEELSERLKIKVTQNGASGEDLLDALTGGI